MSLLLAFLIGFFGGLRSLTAPAVTAWAAHLRWIKLQPPLSWIGSPWAAGLFTVLALAELVADMLPNTPSRTAPPGQIARILLGGLSGACVAMAGSQGMLAGALLGILGGLAGCFGGYQARSRLVKALGVPDFLIALLEDAIAIGGSVWVVSRF
jgi:uncharacterized membrane protein